MRYRSVLAVLSISVLLIGATCVSAGGKYYGFIEQDKGEGVWVLVKTNDVFSSRVDTHYAAGLLAEFNRRHKELRIVNVFPVFQYSDSGHSHPFDGFVIFTELRFQK